MASSSISGYEAQYFHCHQCDATVRPSSFVPLTCPYCEGNFLEECADSPPSSPELHSPWDYMGAFGQILDDISTFLARTDVSGVNPFLLFQSQMQSLLNAHDDEFLPHHIHDDDFDSGFQHIVQHLAENDPNRYGSPPASAAAVNSLPTISISQTHLDVVESMLCAVCKDEFEFNAQVKQMPCKHLYHPDCILPWLGQHNSCPVCRYELPTDDLDYEHARLQDLCSRNLPHVVWLGSNDHRQVQGLSNGESNMHNTSQNAQLATRRPTIPGLASGEECSVQSDTRFDMSENSDGECPITWEECSSTMPPDTLEPGNAQSPQKPCLSSVSTDIVEFSISPGNASTAMHGESSNQEQMEFNVFTFTDRISGTNPSLPAISTNKADDDKSTPLEISNNKDSNSNELNEGMDVTSGQTSKTVRSNMDNVAMFQTRDGNPD